MAGDQGRAALGAVLDDLGDVAPLGIAQRGEQPVVDRKQVQFGEAGEQPCEGAVAAPDGELMEQARHAEVARREAAATRPLNEGTGKEALADAGGAGDEQIVVVGDPGAAAQGEDLLAVEPAGVGEVDGLERGGIAELGRLQPPGQLALLAGGPLGVDQQAEAFLEAQRGDIVGPELVLDGLGHGPQLHRVQFVERLFDQHRSSSGVAGA